ncbi:hypothetical protein [Streptomyces prunicolor]|uniref:hypothetical protein n=1 Tax=Streptomyces prunicolor TaxID=67348 RepID=UPI0033EAF226
MARVAIPVTTSDRAGVTVPAATTGDATNNHSVVNSGSTVLLVKNTGATTARTVSFHLDRTVDGFTPAPRAESIPFGVTQVFGPFPVADYGPILMVDVDNAELTVQALRI